MNHFKSFKKILYGGYLMMKKDTSSLDRPSKSLLWLKKIITWSILITMSLFFFHNDFECMNFNPSSKCKVWKWMEDALRVQKIISHFMNFHQLQQVITFWIFGVFKWFKSQNIIQEIYFMPYFLVMNKFQVEGHVWMQDIISYFWRKT